MPLTIGSMNNKHPQAVVLWVIWATSFVLVFIHQFFIGGGIPSGETSGDSPMVFISSGIVAIVISTLIRWILIPKAKSVRKVLMLMIAGLALSGSVELFGINLIGSDFQKMQLIFFILSALGVFQFIPTYLCKFKIDDNPVSTSKKKTPIWVYPVAVISSIYAIWITVDFIYTANTRKFAVQFGNAWKDAEQKYPQESMERTEYFIATLKTLDAKYTPDGLEENFNNYVLNFELAIEAMKEGKSAKEFDVKTAEAKDRLLEVIKENYDY